MGTLANQQPRDRCNVSTNTIDAFLQTATELATKHNVCVADVIAAKIALEAERRNDLLATDGDANDEQLAGFGEIAKALVVAIAELDLGGGRQDC